MILFFAFLCSISLVHGAEISKEIITDTIAIELTIPAQYNVTLRNNASRGINFSIYSIADINITPEKMFVQANSEVNFLLKALPARKNEGYHLYKYYFKEAGQPALEDELIIKILPVKKILSMEIPGELARDDKAINLIVSNKENIDLGTINLTVSSELFTFSNTLDLKPKETKNYTINVDLKNKIAGPYAITFQAFLNNEYLYEKKINVTLKEVSNITEVKDKKWHFFGYTNMITKKNEGNARKIVTVELPLGSFEQSFTDYNIEPTSKIKQQGKVLVTWQRELQPGESFTVEARTNYTTLVVVVIIVAIVLIFYLIFFNKKVLIKKKAIRLRTKGDEFAAKVIIVAKNIGKEIRNVKLTDRLPMNTQLYEKFGTVKPDKIEKNHIEWNFPNILPGEEIVASYIVYSKVGMTGVQLPQASLSYTDEKDKRRTISSAKVLVL